MVDSRPEAVVDAVAAMVEAEVDAKAACKIISKVVWAVWKVKEEELLLKGTKISIEMQRNQRKWPERRSKETINARKESSVKLR